ncbi:MAG TPA: hypothetical protein VF590_09775 [Isosphaeraceae bacterium]|jgi:hypothetical protein
MTNLVFVHGINTRGDDYGLAFERIRSALARRRPDVSVAPCRWGDDLGAVLKGGGKSIPRYEQTKGLGDPVDEALRKADVWELLDGDPLAELRLMALRSTPRPAPALFNPRGGETAAEELERQAREGLGPDSDHMKDLIDRAGLTAADLTAARRAVSFDPAFATAVRTVDPDAAPEEVAPAWARAVVALAMADHPDAPLGTDADTRDSLVEALADTLTGELRTRGLVGDWVGRALAVFGTRYLLGRRGRYTDLIVPVAGDILVYQVHGQAIRDRIIASLPGDGPVVLLGHSLGGVACVDLLARTELPAVQLLVTVGSQAPFFYEIGALQGLGYPGTLPAHFPRWVNVYDPRDFLSYVAEGLFAASAPQGVSDIRVDNRQPFPRSHSAYWTNPQTWDTIVPQLP